MSQRTHFLPFCFLFLLAGQALTAQDISLQARMQAAVDRLHTDREQAKNTIDSVWNLPNLTAEERNYVHNALGIFFGMSGKVDSATYHFHQVMDHSRDELTRAKAMLNLSIVFREKGTYDQALDLQRRSEQILLRLDDKLHLSRLYGAMASTFSKQFMHGSAVAYLLKGIDMLESMPDQSAQHAALLILRQKLANTYVLLDDDSFALRIYEEIIPSFRADSNLWNLAISQLTHAEVLRRLGRLEAAFDALEEALDILGRYQNAEYLAYALRAKARVAITAGRPEQEIKTYFAEAVKLTQYPENEYGQLLFSDYLTFLSDRGRFTEADSLIRFIEQGQVFRKAPVSIRRHYHYCRAKVYEGLGRWEAGMRAAMTAADYADSLRQAALLTQSRTLQEQYKSKTFEQEARMAQMTQAELQKKIRIRNLNLLVAVLFLSIVVVAAFHFRLQLRYKHIRLVRLEEEHRSARREQQWLNEITRNQQQLIRQQEIRLQESALELSHKNASLENLLTKVQDRDGQELKHAILDLKDGAAQRNTILLRFNELYPDFLNTLRNRFPELTQSDLEFCALLKLNLSYKDIANVMNIHHRSAFTRKYRIAQKMKVEADQDIVKIIHET